MTDTPPTNDAPGLYDRFNPDIPPAQQLAAALASLEGPSHAHANTPAGDPVKDFTNHLVSTLFTLICKLLGIGIIIIIVYTLLWFFLS
jgi:hypothetical protein